MQILLSELTPSERYRWLISSIIPRPIAFISTISSSGVTNLAPFSFFNGVTSTPAVVSIAIGADRSGGQKDTLRNIESTGVFVVNVATVSMAPEVVLCSGDWPATQSEFDLSGLTAIPSAIVKAPRVEESPLSMECRLLQIVPVGEPSTSIVLGEVLVLHVRDEILTGGSPDPEKLQPLARLGGNSYASLGDLFEIARPRVKR